MSKAVMRSLPPQVCERIITDRQTMLVVKQQPKLKTPYKEYIYMTKTKRRGYLWEYDTAYQNSKGDIVDGSQKVIGEYIVDRIEPIACHKYHNGVGFDYSYYTESNDNITDKAHLTDYDMQQRLGCAEDGEVVGYGLNISNLIIYDKPKELGEFRHYVDCCENPKIECSKCKYSRRHYSSGVLDCGNKVTSPPQSYFYVEEN